METLNFTELITGLINNRESEYIEFKTSNDDPKLFGETVCALANGAILANKEEAYLIYGIDDDSNIVGTKFNPYKKAKGQPFINLIATKLRHAEPLIYKTGEVEGKPVVIIIIPRAKLYPVEFEGTAYIRVDSAKKKLSEHPELARKLWELILKHSFEDSYATELVSRKTIFDLLDFSPYYSRRNTPVPNNHKTIIDTMQNEGVLVKKLDKYYITNLDALLFAKDMSNFPTLINRDVRIIKYKGHNKIDVERSLDFHEGYALCIDKIAETVNLLLPTEEIMIGTERQQQTTFTEDIIRELLSNILIHQDFSVDGYYPRIEIFSDRIEFTNSGTPIIDTNRFLDLNMSRNAKLAKLARFMRMCEERGMGFDKVESACEESFLPSPIPSASDGITRVIVFGHKSLRQFSKQDRVNLVYMHCCFQYINQNQLTNETLRQRFPDNVMSPIVASRWISEALHTGIISKFDPNASRKNSSYIPTWAK